jgi:hypothetical protein
MLEYPRIVAQKFTSKQKWFAGVAFSLVLVVVAVFIYTALASDDISNQPTQGNKLYQAMISVLLALLGTLVVTLFAMVFDPIRKWLERYFSRPDGNSSLRILLFGAPGSGKSAFADHVLTIKPLVPMKSSSNFTIRSGKVVVNGQKPEEILLADYQGQKPSQVTSSIPDEFAGPPGERSIDAIVFFVDLIPRVEDPKTNRVFDDRRLLAWLAERPGERTKERLEQHKYYISDAVLEILFEAVHSTRLREVRLLVTKSDLLRRASTEGVFGPEGQSIEEYTTSFFAAVESRIRAACIENSSPVDGSPINCSTHFISLRDESARVMFYELLQKLVPAPHGELNERSKVVGQH